MTVNETLEDIKKQNIKVAMDLLSHAMRIDPEYAHSWHCNLAMAFYDSFNAELPVTHMTIHKIANEGASRFMKQTFNVETSQDGPKEAKGE